MAAKKNKPDLRPRIYEIDFARGHDFEIGALLLVLMAFPLETIKNEELERYTSALCTWALMERGRRDKAWAGRPLEIEPKLFSVPEHEVARIIRTFERRLRDRAHSGWAANHLIFKTANPDYRLPQGAEVSNQQSLIKVILDATNQNDGKNLAQRGIVSQTVPAVKAECVGDGNASPPQASQPIPMVRQLAGGDPAGGADVRQVPSVAAQR